MKKAFFRLMLLVLGLNVFTACYGPAPGGDWAEPDNTELAAPDDGTSSGEEEEEGSENAE